MIYAPVLITTVNRYAHFKDCIETLSQCTWADKTDVFIAVDYPGKEAHWEGYRKIRNYLEHCGDMGFKSLNVTYRETNYFYSGKGNLTTLRDEVFKTYDRVIVSEDDNVFSPNFLVYIDKGLEKFEKDPTVLAINGYRDFSPLDFDDNTFFRQNIFFYAWGYGIWRNKYINYIKLISPSFFRQKVSMNTFRNLKKNGNAILLKYIERCFINRTIRDDNAISILMTILNMDVIMPKFSCVRNMGWDGTGINCNPATYGRIAQAHSIQEIDDSPTFIYKGTGHEFYQENHKSIVTNSFKYINNLRFCFLLTKLIVKIIFHKIK